MARDGGANHTVLMRWAGKPDPRWAGKRDESA
jgi:hypothetical protein